MPGHDATCQTCGAVLPASARGRCAACLFADALDGGAESAPLGMIDGCALLEELARGGMGVVYRAREREPERIVALKTVRGALLETPGLIERFRREAAAMAELEHPAILPVFHFGEYDGAPYFTMKLATGGTLARRLPRYAGDWRGIAELMIKIADGVQHAHMHGVLHRDLKPGNILFDENEHAYVSDFGLATALDADATRLTLTAALVGTPHYVAPEVAASDTRAATTASDVWSLGVVLYELIAQHRPFEAEGIPALLRRVVEEDPVPLYGIGLPVYGRGGEIAHVPRDLATIAHKALAKEPAGRYASAGALAEDLRRWLDGKPILARPTSTFEKALLWAHRNPALTATAVLAVGALLAAIFGLGWGLDQERRRNEQLRSSHADEQERLRTALIDGARLGRLARGAGSRRQGLAALRKAAEIRAGADVRDEVIAHLALLDLEREPPLAAVPTAARGKLTGDPARAQPSPDFTRVAWCLDNEEVLIAHADDSREPARVPPVVGASLLGTAWSPDGSLLAIAYHGRTHLIDVATRELILVLPALREPPSGQPPVSFSADGTRLGVLRDGAAVVLALPDGEELSRAQPIAGDNIDGCRVHPSQPWLAAWSDSELVVWDYAAGRAMQSVPLASEIATAAWSPDGRVLAVALFDRTIVIIDVTRPAARKGSFILRGHSERALALAFSPDGALLFSTARDGQTRVWDALTGGESLVGTYEGVMTALSSDGTRVGFLDHDGLGAWRIVRGDPVYRALSGRVRQKLMGSVDFSPDGRWLAAAAKDPDGLWLWDCATGRLVTEALSPGVKRGWLRWKPGGGGVLTAGADGLVAWPLAEGGLGAGEPVSALAWDRPREAVALSADGRMFAVGTREKSFAVLDLAAGGAARTFDTETKIGRLAFGPDARQLAIGSGHWAADSLVIDLADGAIRARLPGSDSEVAFSPDGRWLARFDFHQCEIRDARTWKVVHTFPRSQWVRRAGGMDFSRDGRFFACLMEPDRGTIFDAVTFAPLATFQLPAGATAGAVRFSPDAEWFALHDTTQLHLFHLPSLRRELAPLGLAWP